MRLRDYTPRGYNARHILILIVPMLVFVIAMTLFFFSNHVQEVNSKLSRAVAQELSLVIDRQSKLDPPQWAAFVNDLRAHQLMEIDFQQGVDELSAPPGRSCCAEFGRELAIRVDLPFVYAYDPRDMMSVRILMSDGVLEARFDRKRVVIITAHIFIVWSVGFSLLLLVTSYMFLRNQVRSILQLAEAADAFGRGEDVANYKPSGASEVRQAARSVIRMRNRIRRYADQRTAMLAGVSHDLRTPLTRLKLELAMLPRDVDAKAAKADILEMERMLDGYLAFARGEEAEQPIDADVVELTQDATSHLSARTNFELIAPSHLRMRVRVLALKRAISNLANNAADYGDKVRVVVLKEPGAVVMQVEDDGPGIPEASYTDAFKPFSRLDASRNQNVSGVGLGLTIARDIARSHGGDVTLGRSELGGLRATIRLPLSQDRQKEND